MNTHDILHIAQYQTCGNEKSRIQIQLCITKGHSISGPNGGAKTCLVPVLLILCEKHDMLNCIYSITWWWYPFRYLKVAMCVGEDRQDTEAYFSWRCVHNSITEGSKWVMFIAFQQLKHYCKRVQTPVVVNSLVPGRCGCNIKLVICKQISGLDILNIPCAFSCL